MISRAYAEGQAYRSAKRSSSNPSGSAMALKGNEGYKVNEDEAAKGMRVKEVKASRRKRRRRIR